MSISYTYSPGEMAYAFKTIPVNLTLSETQTDIIFVFLVFILWMLTYFKSVSESIRCSNETVWSLSRALPPVICNTAH